MTIVCSIALHEEVMVQSHTVEMGRGCYAVEYSCIPLHDLIKLKLARKCIACYISPVHEHEHACIILHNHTQVLLTVANNFTFHLGQPSVYS